MYIGIANAMRRNIALNQDAAARCAARAVERRCTPMIGVNDDFINFNAGLAAEHSEEARDALFALVAVLAPAETVDTAPTPEQLHADAVQECYSRIMERYANMQEVPNLCPNLHMDYMYAVPQHVFNEALARVPEAA